MQSFFAITLGDILGSGIASAIVSAVVGTLLLRREKRLEAEIKAHFDERFFVTQSTRIWREHALSELFGPIVMQFERTRRAFRRFTEQNLYLEAKILGDGNRVIRDLLLSKAHLIPPNLFSAASELIEHYDRWLEEFDKERIRKAPEDGAEFVFVGTKGCPFPKDAEDKFLATFKELQTTLYGL